MTLPATQSNDIIAQLRAAGAVPSEVEQLATQLVAALRPSESIRYADFTEPRRVHQNFVRTTIVVVVLSAAVAYAFPYGWLLAPVLSLVLLPFRLVSRLTPLAVWAITDDSLICTTAHETVRRPLQEVNYMMRNPLFDAVMVVYDERVKAANISYPREAQKMIDELLVGVNRTRAAAGLPESDMLYMLPPAQHMKQAPTAVIIGLACGIGLYCLYGLPAATAGGETAIRDLFMQGMLYGFGGALATFAIYTLVMTQIAARTSIAIKRTDGTSKLKQK